MASTSDVPTTLPQQAADVVSPAEPEIQPTKTKKSIAIVICSTRPGRVNPALAKYIKSLLPVDNALDVVTVDLKIWDLPMFNEATIPAALPASDPTPGYSTEHARRWSSEVSKYSAFLFVTPQYNWSLPASVKNALDYLYHEWVGKSALVVSYGGHGGGKGKEALEAVLGALKMKVVEGTEITINPREGMKFGEKEVDGELVQRDVPDEMKAKWKEAGVEEQVKEKWGKLVGTLEGKL